MPNTVKMPPLELLIGKYDGETVRQFINTCDTFSKLPGKKKTHTHTSTFLKNNAF